MERRLVQRRAAEDDVAEQLGYIAADRPAVAHRYAMALEDAYERPRTMPDLGVSGPMARDACATCECGRCPAFDGGFSLGVSVHGRDPSKGVVIGRTDPLTS